MLISEFVKANELASKTQLEKVKLLCFYQYKEYGEETFTMVLVSKLVVDAGFNKPNNSRLKNYLTKGNGKLFINSETDKGKLRFIPAVLQEMELSLGQAWQDRETIASNSEMIDEVKFCGKRNYLTKIIQQINLSYGNNCYDACAVLMRRLFEVVLIHAYQNLGMEDSIKFGDGKHFPLEKIVNDSKNNPVLNLSFHVKKDLDIFREIGNLSAHSITYTAGRKDIDEIKIKYRVMLEEIYYKAGII